MVQTTVGAVQCCSQNKVSGARRRRPLVTLGCFVASATYCSAFTSSSHHSIHPPRSPAQRSTIHTDYSDLLLLETTERQHHHHQSKQPAAWEGMEPEDLEQHNSEDNRYLPRSVRRKWQTGEYVPQRAMQLSHGLEDSLLLSMGGGESLFATGTTGGDDPNNKKNKKEDKQQKGSKPMKLPTCRVVALADAKLPTPSEDVLPTALFRTPHMLRRLDDIYHASAHDETRRLKYTQDEDQDKPSSPKEEEGLVSVTRTSLEDAGFSLMSRRDLDLCEALNAGYLLRLSIVPDVSNLDPSIAQEFYPERFNEEDEPINPEELLFDGRVLVYRRGYSQEVSKGRLLLPKIDYLQASLVQRSAAWIKRRLDQVEEAAFFQAGRASRQVVAGGLRVTRSLVDRVPNQKVSSFLRSKLPKDASRDMLPPMASNGTNFFKLSRYGGSRTRFVGSPNPLNALEPFQICQAASGEYCPPCPMQRENYLSGMNGCEECDADALDPCGKNDVPLSLKCPYDVGTSLGPDLKRPPMQLLERVTIGTLVNVFSRDGRRKLFQTLFSKSELVEPTYEEVVVVWRPLPAEETKPKKPRMPAPPKLVYELADQFDFVEKLPPKPTAEEPKKSPEPLEIRTFEGVPMANLPAVMPKTKLIFRPADAFVFDFVSIASFLLVIGSQRFDSPKLDLLAVVSVSLWLLRTVLRYSNKLARYDLLVKTFLTSKISHRNAGALKYLAFEAGSQRATRAALVHSWLSRRVQHQQGNSVSSNIFNACNTRTQLVREGSAQVNNLLSNQDNEIPMNVDAALNDLEDLELVKFTKERSERPQQLVQVVENSDAVVQRLKRAWDKVFEGRMTLEDLAGRRNPVEETSAM